MVTLGEAVKDKVASDNFQQNKNLGSTSNEIKSVQEGVARSVSPKNEPVELDKIQSSSVKLSAAECNNEGNTQLKRTENSNKKQSGQEEVILSASLVKTESSSDKVSAAESTKVNTQLIKTDGELENVKPGQSSDNKLKNETNSSSRDGNPLSAIPGGAPQIIKQAPQSPSFSENEISGSSLAPTPMEVSDKSHLNPKTDADGNQTNRELIIYASIPAKPLNSLQPVHSPKVGTDGLRRDQEVRTPTRVPDKVSLDGYNWRKYGQKLVKGNEFVRSYYRCTHPNCQAKRQVERTHDGQITDAVYLGKHEHPKPQPSPRATGGSAQPIQAIKSDEPSSAVGKDKSSSALLLESCLPDPKDSPQPSTPTDNSPKTVTPQSNRTRDELDNSREPESKKQRTDISNIAETPFEKSNGESKVVVQTMSEVDIVNDGFRWRKYGQKLVKGNPNPRSYYRCSNPGCGVKKHVERASHDPKVVITTYEGHHDHGTPPCRTVTPNSSGPAPDLNGESRPKLEEKSEAPRLDIVVHIGDN